MVRYRIKTLADCGGKTASRGDGEDRLIFRCRTQHRIILKERDDPLSNDFKHFWRNVVLVDRHVRILGRAADCPSWTAAADALMWVWIVSAVGLAIAGAIVVLVDDAVWRPGAVIDFQIKFNYVGVRMKVSVANKARFLVPTVPKQQYVAFDELRPRRRANSAQHNPDNKHETGFVWRCRHGFNLLTIRDGAQAIRWQHPTTTIVAVNLVLTARKPRDLVDAAPKPVKEKISKADADALKAKLEEAGAAVEIK